MKTIFFSYTSAFIALMLTGCNPALSQAKSPILKARAYYADRVPGAQMVDPRTGEPIHRIIRTVTVYIQTGIGTVIQWDSAAVCGQVMIITAERLAVKRAEVGTSAKGGQKIVETVASGNVLWKLQFSIRGDQAVMDQPVIPFVLKGKYKGKSVQYRITSAVELSTIPSV